MTTVAVRVQLAGRTHVGLIRKRNEDSLYVGRHLVAVADGLGGHVAGDVASAAVIDAVREHDHLVDEDGLASLLSGAVAGANAAVRARIAGDRSLAGMGSTLVAMAWAGPAAVVANLGDSRIYLRRGDATVQVTEDHTYEHLVAAANRVPGLPGKLARWIDGRADGRSADVAAWRLRPGDRWLLCSDGLSSYVPYEAMHQVLCSPATAADVADRLIALAIHHGGHDNVTVILMDVS